MTQDTGGYLVVDDGPVVFADNVNAEFLIKCGALCNCVTVEANGRDLQR